MFEAFFGMEHTPFARDIPVENLYSSIGYEETLGRLVYASERQLFAVLTANVGCGKTTVIGISHAQRSDTVCQLQSNKRQESNSKH